MAQTPQKRGPEPWLNPPQKGVPSHGSNLQKRGSQAMALKVFRAMAQTPKNWGPEPWLKLNFVLHILTSFLVSFFGFEYVKLKLKHFGTEAYVCIVSTRFIF